MPRRKVRELPKINSEFTRVYKGKTYKLKVVKTETSVAYDLNGHIYATPTAAAKSLVKNEVNGWQFWSMDK